MGGNDGLLRLEVSEFRSVEVGRRPALGQQDLGLGSRVRVEAWPGELLDSELSSGVSLSSGESSSIGGHSEVTAEQLLLSPDHLLSSGDIRDLEEPGDSVTVGIVGAGGSREAGRELGGGQGHGGHREEQQGLHLDMWGGGKL